jgi:hypothetical protein
MSYEKILSLLISASAVLTAIMGVTISWRYSVASGAKALDRMSEYFRSQTDSVNRQTEALLQEKKSVESLFTNPEALDLETLNRIQALADNIAGSLKLSMREKRGFEKLVANDDGAREAYERNIAASINALESVEKLRASMASLIAAREGQNVNG